MRPLGFVDAAHFAQCAHWISEVLKHLMCVDYVEGIVVVLASP